MPLCARRCRQCATEAVQDHLVALGYETGLDRDVLVEAAEMAQAMRSDS